MDARWRRRSPLIPAHRPKRRAACSSLAHLCFVAGRREKEGERERTRARKQRISSSLSSSLGTSRLSACAAPHMHPLHQSVAHTSARPPLVPRKAADRRRGKERSAAGDALLQPLLRLLPLCLCPRPLPSALLPFSVSLLLLSMPSLSSSSGSTHRCTSAVSPAAVSLFLSLSLSLSLCPSSLLCCFPFLSNALHSPSLNSHPLHAAAASGCPWSLSLAPAT